MKIINNEMNCSDLRDELLYVVQSGFISSDRQNGTVLHLSVCVFLLLLFVCVGLCGGKKHINLGQEQIFLFHVNNMTVLCLFGHANMTRCLLLNTF